MKLWSRKGVSSMGVRRNPVPAFWIARASEGGEQRGVDVHKQTRGRKRHIVTDTLGLLLIVLVHSAGLQDGAGGYQVLQKLFVAIKRCVHHPWCRLILLWADAAYVSIVEKVRKTFGWKLEIVRRSDQAQGFEVLPHRWIVE
jgi:putative transposase